MRYYYAAGERQELSPVDDLVAVGLGKAADPDLVAAVRALPGISRLPGGMVVVSRAALDEGLRARLEAGGLTQPVYRAGSSMVVLLPEVRVELEAGQQASAVAAMEQSIIPSDMISAEPERLALKPRSESAEDALDLANDIYERARPASASVRMLRIGARPAG